MKRILAILLTFVLLVSVMAACTPAQNDTTGAKPNPSESKPSESKPADDKSKLDLMGMCTVTDPEGVEYDERVALYMPYLEGSEEFDGGRRYSFCVLYGKGGKGVYMYSVEVFENNEQAEACKAAAGEGTVEGAAYITTADAAFFAAMEAFIPDLATYIDNMSASGMMELE